jgi:flagellar basal-body rod protein FlgC
MSENIFATFDISGQGMSVQRMRLNAVARNIANANTTNGPDGVPYQREVVQVTSKGNRNFGNELKNSIELNITDDSHSSGSSINKGATGNTTLEAVTVNDGMPPRMVYDPHHPDANKDGYVLMPDINIVSEMVEMISAQRAFQANAGVIDSAKNIARFSFEI